MIKFTKLPFGLNFLYLLLYMVVLGACKRHQIPQQTNSTSNNTKPAGKPTNNTKPTNNVESNETKENSAGSVNSNIFKPKREFRAAWVATVDNIDWPSRKGLASDVQQDEFRKILDFHKNIGLNAVLVQIRAASDAFYAKSNEPWSEWLMGDQGQAPSPFYDPIRFMIIESHLHGLEFHAWLNMNRGTHKAAKSIAKDHITNTNPSWFLSYGGSKLYNLGIPEVRTYIVQTVRNLVKNYDVDGIHFDDYFYPYTIPNEYLNDGETYKKYKGGFNNIEDWRRNNVNLVIEAVSKVINSEKPWVRFGISPFCVWRNKRNDPKGSDTQGGQTSFDNLYADTRMWLTKGWVDYMAPQVYFSFEHTKVPYKTMVDWWQDIATDRHIYIGQAAYKVLEKSSDKAWTRGNQIPKQIRHNRSQNILGSIYFSSKSLLKNPLGIADSLKKIYKNPALMPTMAWKDAVPPNTPKKFEAKRDNVSGTLLSWELPDMAKDNEEVYGFVIYRFNENEKIFLENPSKILKIVRNEGMLNYVDKEILRGQTYTYVITALDRLQNESPPSNSVSIKQ